MSKTMHPSISIVMPVYNDQKSCKALLQDIAAIAGSNEWNFCLVDDGSNGERPEVTDIKSSKLGGVVLRLMRNVGHQKAIACGLGFASSKWPDSTVILIDADGEDRPSDIPRLLSAIEGKRDGAAVAARANRSEGPAFRIFYRFYKILFRLLTGKTIRFGNFMALTPAAARRLCMMDETWTHVAASLLASRTPLSFVDTDRGHRYSGQSTMNFVSLAVHAMRATMVFSDIVFMRVLILSFTLIAATASVSLIAVAMKIFGLASPGWLTSVLGSAFSTTIQVSSLAAVSLVLAEINQKQPPKIVQLRYNDYIAEVEEAK